SGDPVRVNHDLYAHYRQFPWKENCPHQEYSCGGSHDRWPYVTTLRTMLLQVPFGELAQPLWADDVQDQSHSGQELGELSCATPPQHRQASQFSVPQRGIAVEPPRPGFEVSNTTHRGPHKTDHFTRSPQFIGERLRSYNRL